VGKGAWAGEEQGGGEKQGGGAETPVVKTRQIFPSLMAGWWLNWEDKGGTLMG
jgi:hypothetical protein